MQTNNIFIIGFMAAGKSSLAKELANNLNYNLLDTDDYIAKQESMTIREIFSKKGEQYFREQEYKALQYAQNLTNTVVALGAGAVGYFKNFCLLSKVENIFFLDTPLSIIAMRLEQQNERPLYDDDWENRYYMRLALYKQLGITINSYNKSNLDLTNEINNIVQAQNKLPKNNKINIKTEKNNYPIYIEKNILLNIKNIINSLNLINHKVAIITNKHIANILSKDLLLLKNNFDNCLVIMLEDSEKHKNLQSVNYCYEQLLAKNYPRQSLILAFGGGVIGDMAGFVAATYMRGVPFIQIPTTLLACIDSSIGGKTAVDMPAGKNLVGAFYNPCAVIIDENLLKTLPTKDYNAAMAEVIKHALIFDDIFFNDLLTKDLDLHNIIIRSLNIKKYLVEKDFHENHVRCYLNFGHTFAHALEKVSNYQLRHGEAVAIGMMMETKLALYLGILKEDFTKELKAVLNKFNLDSNYPLVITDLINALAYDKKNDLDKIGFALPIKKGQMQKCLVNQKDILDFLATLS